MFVEEGLDGGASHVGGAGDEVGVHCRGAGGVVGGGGTDVASLGVEDDGEVEGFGFGDDMLEDGVSGGSIPLETCGLGLDDSDERGDEVEDGQAVGLDAVDARS